MTRDDQDGAAMTGTVRLRWPGYRMFDYERDLAAREVAALVHTPPRVVADGLEVDTDEIGLLAGRLTYPHALTCGDRTRPTGQGTVEAVHQRYRGSAASRQATRFLVHGLHEYKGKFNPQLARALSNIADPEAAALLDPFCGSGTTLVEGLRLGLRVAGIDRSPLAAWLSRVKLATLTARHPDRLRAEFDTLRHDALRAIKQGRHTGQPPRTPPLDHATRDYLARWFPAEVLAGLLGALGAATDRPGPAGDPSPAGDLVRLAVSGIARAVSWQLPEDLRIRRRPAGWIPPEVAVLFDEACARIDTALAELAAHPPIAPGRSWAVRHGSGDDPQTVGAVWPDGRRLVVTSPPYATALPYIDTDRLSIALLGLAPPGALGSLERALTGSREWSRAEAARWLARRQHNADDLPGSLLRLLATIEAQHADLRPGFRRRDVPPLLYRYFAAMGAALRAWAAHLRPGERAVLVVGRNRTGPKGHQITVDTPRLLADLAPRRGFTPVELIGLQTWPRFGLHARNGVDTEDAVILERHG